MESPQIEIQLFHRSEPGEKVFTILPEVTIKIVPTDTVLENGARLYTDTFGRPIVYIKECASDRGTPRSVDDPDIG